jgi:hypothetical protein
MFKDKVSFKGKLYEFRIRFKEKFNANFVEDYNKVLLYCRYKV